ncbi:NHLP leader peptide family RiPP precursor [Flavobacterium flavigenum]|uniref:NHLP leader peptide family RiPP precursor n=1 Tax=Flavobacterium flavigenum TaxID=3003258 RepID=UPI0024821B25|nr:NHLP leader peptide family RiPP precursor [Flavobacterium flavigenum]
MEITQEQKLYAEIVQKAWDDAEFKKKLITNPVEVIENFTGKKLNLPAGKTIIVRDQTDESAVYINIPAAPKSVDAQLSDAQLEAVAGGIIGPGGCIPMPGPWIPTPTFPKDIFIL